MKTMENVNLLHGDCIELMKSIPDKSIDLILTDPPYNIKIAKWDNIPNYIEWCGEWLLECRRVLKDNGSFYFFHNDMVQIAQLMEWIRLNTDFVFKQMIVWDKYNGGKWNQLNAAVHSELNRNYSKQAEYCLYYTFQDDKGLSKDRTQCEFNELMNYFKNERLKLGWNYKQCDDFLGIKTSYCYWDKPTTHPYRIPEKRHYLKLQETGFFEMEYEKLREEYESLRYTFNNQCVPSVIQHEPIKQNGHITPKPIGILDILIKTSSNENDVVLDCFMGSGSTGVACVNANRKFIGIELDENYFNIATDRINKAIQEKSSMLF